MKLTSFCLWLVSVVTWTRIGTLTVRFHKTINSLDDMSAMRLGYHVVSKWRCFVVKSGCVTQTSRIVPSGRGNKRCAVGNRISSLPYPVVFSLAIWRWPHIIDISLSSQSMSIIYDWAISVNHAHMCVTYIWWYIIMTLWSKFLYYCKHISWTILRRFMYSARKVFIL